MKGIQNTAAANIQWTLLPIQDYIKISSVLVSLSQTVQVDIKSLWHSNVRSSVLTINYAKDANFQTDNAITRCLEQNNIVIPFD